VRAHVSSSAGVALHHVLSAMAVALCHAGLCVKAVPVPAVDALHCHAACTLPLQCLQPADQGNLLTYRKVGRHSPRHILLLCSLCKLVAALVLPPVCHPHCIRFKETRRSGLHCHWYRIYIVLTQSVVCAVLLQCVAGGGLRLPCTAVWSLLVNIAVTLLVNSTTCGLKHWATPSAAWLTVLSIDAVFFQLQERLHSTQCSTGKTGCGVVWSC
jgi:hypothetical protein